MKRFLPLAILIVLVVLLITAVRTCMSYRTERNSLQDAFNRLAEQSGQLPLAPVVTQVTDSVANTSRKTVRPTSTVDISQYVPRTYADSLRRLHDIDVKNITRLKQFTVTLQDSIKGLLSRDTLYNQWASMRDNVFDIRYNLTSNTFYPSATIKLDLVDHYRPATLFRQRQKYSTIIANDHRVDIGNVRLVDENKALSRFGIDANIGYFATPDGFTLGVGIGLGYRIFQF